MTVSRLKPIAFVFGREKDESEREKRKRKVDEDEEERLGMVATTSPHCSLYRIVVFPAPSRPRIRIRTSSLPQILLNRLAKMFPVIKKKKKRSAGKKERRKEGQKMRKGDEGQEMWRGRGKTTDPLCT